MFSFVRPRGNVLGHAKPVQKRRSPLELKWNQVASTQYLKVVRTNIFQKIALHPN